MPGILIENFKGLYTNIDSNQAPPDIFSTHINFKVGQGFIEIEPNKLVAMTSPPPLASGESYETGVYCTITNDAIDNSNNIVLTKYNLFIVITISLSAGVYSRKIFFQDVTSTPTAWEELSLEGATTTPNINISRTFFQTSKIGKTFFKLHDGRLGIFMPHDCFWLGLVKRTLYTSPTATVLDQIYLDRMLEGWEGESLSLDNSGACYSTARQGIKYSPEIVTGDTVIVEERAVNIDYFSRTLVDFYTGGTTNIHEFNVTIAEDASDVPIIITYPDPDVDLGTRHWAYEKDGATDTLLIPDVWFSAVQRLDSSLVEIAPATYATFRTDPIVDGPHGAVGNYWEITKTDFLSYTDWYYVGNTTIADSGFTNSVHRADLVTTCLLDERDEIIIHTKSLNIDQVGKWALKISSVLLATNFNFRTTRYRFYIKLDKLDADYELVKEFNLLDDKFEIPDFFYISDFQREGIFLAQNIGFLFDIDKPKAYKPILGFRDIAILGKIAIGISSDNYTNIFYSTIGGGNIQTHLMLTENIVPIPGASMANAIGELSRYFLVATSIQSFIVAFEEVAGVLAFTVKDTIEYGVEAESDLIQAQGTVFLNTIEGIIATDGIKTSSLSFPIDDILDEFRATGYNIRIFYNSVFHELYVLATTGTIGRIFRFRFLTKSWEELVKWSTYNGVQHIIFNFSGLLTEIEGLYISQEDTSISNNVFSIIGTHLTDLGQPNVDKLLNYIDIDYEGTFSLIIYTYPELESTPYTYTLVPPTNSNRGSKKLYIKVDDRKPFKKMNLFVSSNLATGKIYRIYSDYTFLPRRFT